jgi:hypothetical protein
VHRIRLVAGVVAAAVTIAVVAVVSGCASGPGTTVTLKSAKDLTLQLESQIAGFVPDAQVTSTQQTKTSKVIFPCVGHDDQSYWPGTETLSLKDGVDDDAILSAIAANWTNKSGWSVFKSTGDDGKSTLDLKSADGYSFTVAFVDGPQLTINSLSACFPTSSVSGQTSY